ncbi:hypothetical protein C8Q76DRAFT_747972 [Earliella scabrosa]|nr:hypothetical protein C8Q76DRAFT_747972 [Earliella scabrosa]
MSLAPWDIYARSLEPLGYGYPLWGPEPSSEFGEVRLGDVGYIQRGHFCFLFNTMLEATHPVNMRGVPDAFETFTCDGASEHTRDIMQSVLHSEGVQSATGKRSFTMTTVSDSVPRCVVVSTFGVCDRNGRPR